MDDRTPPPKVTGSFSLGVVGVGTVGLTGSRYCSVRAGRSHATTPVETESRDPTARWAVQWWWWRSRSGWSGGGGVASRGRRASSVWHQPSARQGGAGVRCDAQREGHVQPRRREHGQWASFPGPSVPAQHNSRNGEPAGRVRWHAAWRVGTLHAPEPASAKRVWSSWRAVLGLTQPYPPQGPRRGPRTAQQHVGEIGMARGGRVGCPAANTGSCESTNDGDTAPAQTCHFCQRQFISIPHHHHHRPLITKARHFPGPPHSVALGCRKSRQQEKL